MNQQLDYSKAIYEQLAKLTSIIERQNKPLQLSDLTPEEQKQAADLRVKDASLKQIFEALFERDTGRKAVDANYVDWSNWVSQDSLKRAKQQEKEPVEITLNFAGVEQ